MYKISNKIYDKSFIASESNARRGKIPGKNRISRIVKAFSNIQNVVFIFILLSVALIVLNL